MFICIKGIKTTLLPFSNFSGPSMLLNLEMIALHTSAHNLSGTYHYLFIEESCKAVCVSVSMMNFSQLYTSSKAIMEPNSLHQYHATTVTWSWFRRERKFSSRQCVQTHMFLCVSFVLLVFE